MLTFIFMVAIMAIVIVPIIKNDVRNFTDWGC